MLNKLTGMAKPLKRHIIDLIRLKGPLSVADYMKIVLTNPSSGFYMNNDVFGIKGHFTTSPEVSQMFGEVLAVWLINEWKRFGMPEPLRIVELGPGRGTLMLDILRTFDKLISVKNKVTVDLIEISPALEKIQQSTLSNNKNVDSINWFSHINSLNILNDGFSAFIAHEYFDALPIYKFMRDPQSNIWKEIVIDYDQSMELRFCLSNKKSASLLLVPEDLKDKHVEVNAEAALQLEKIVEHLNTSQKGCMLICDYGHEFDDDVDIKSENELRSRRDTFRAFKKHRIDPPLKDPGEADLTADVDFGYLKSQLSDKSLIFGSVNQYNFLKQSGFEVRLAQLLNSTDANDHKILLSEAKMIMEDMGQRYRFMSLFPKKSENLFRQNPPAGFVC